MTSKEAAALYQRLGKSAPAGIAAAGAEHVRGTRRKVVDGIPFSSTLEADCYQLLKSWQSAGAIRNLELQPKFLLQPAFRRGGSPDGETIRAITYKADFRFERDRQIVVVEAKGHRTQPYELRRKMFLAKFPDLIYEIWTREKVKEVAR